jgi:hypothetical protein
VELKIYFWGYLSNNCAGFCVLNLNPDLITVHALLELGHECLERALALVNRILAGDESNAYTSLGFGREVQRMYLHRLVVRHVQNPGDENLPLGADSESDPVPSCGYGRNARDLDRAHRVFQCVTELESVNVELARSG